MLRRRTPAVRFKRRAEKGSACRQCMSRAIREISLPQSLARCIEEMPYQVWMAEDWNRLRGVLTNLDWFNALRAGGQDQLRRYWLSLYNVGTEPEEALVKATTEQLPPYAKWTKHQWQLAHAIVAFLKEAGWAGERCLDLMVMIVQVQEAVRGNVSPSYFDAIRELAALESCGWPERNRACPFGGSCRRPISMFG